ncbi:MAG: YicC family protein [Chlorobi bacterium]|nr:YicC family protein [Chlorobiota bacterium]
MIQSMTGYGKASGSSNDYTFEVEVKSVNSRFLDISVRLPKDLSSKEIELRNLIKQKINRGKVSLNINLSKDGISNGISKIDSKNLLNAVEVLNKIKNEANINEELQLSHLLSYPNLFADNDPELSESELELVKNALIEAIDEMLKMRYAEGEMLVSDLKNRIENIVKWNEDISKLGRDSVEEYFAKLKERAADLVGNISDYDDRLNMELALLAEKYDITEESVRLDSHLKQFLNTLENGKEAGKKLNFLVQEMNREANTLSNKSVSLDITNKAILIKEELEKIREQVQNIE